MKYNAKLLSEAIFVLMRVARSYFKLSKVSNKIMWKNKL